MITHVVLFKLKEPKQTHAEAFRAKLLAMQGRIAALQAIEVGINASPETRASDLVLITHHASWEALHAYADDPVHQEVVAFGKTIILSSTNVDYEG